MSTADPRRTLVDLLPQFLPRRRRGWPAAPLQQSGLQRPEFFLLRAIVCELDADASASYDELLANLFNPYSTIRPVLDALPALVAGGFLAEDSGRYSVTDRGRALILAAEADVRVYVATLRPVPEQEIARLADLFERIAERLWAAPEPAAKSHQQRTQRLPAPAPGSAPQILLDEAAYKLWMARDDAHNAAWRSAGFSGPAFDLLSRLWAGDVSTEAELAELVRHDQRAEDVARGVEELIAAGYAARAEGDEARAGREEQATKAATEQPSNRAADAEADMRRVALTLTERGRTIRDAIEAETDRLYFTPWPPLSDDELAWAIVTLRQVIAGLGE